MLHSNEKINIITQNNFDNLKKTKTKEKDFFSFFKNISNIQELWMKSIVFNKNFFLVPFNSKLQNLNLNTFYNFHYINNTNKSKKSNMKFVVANQEGSFFALISLIYLHQKKSIYINKIDYVRGKPHKILSNAVTNLLDYFRKTFYINNFQISIEKNNSKKEQFFKKLGFKKNTNTVSFAKLYNYFYWQGKKKQIGKKIILTAGPSVSLSESLKTLDAVKHGWNKNWNSSILDLEKNFAKYIGVKYAISTSSCTGALHIAMQSLNISEGDEVIVPDITWVATARVVSYLGATPIFAEIEKDSWNIDVHSIEKLITKKTKAIIAVHLYGNPANLLQLKRLSSKYKISLVEDAAPAIGSSYNGLRCGTVGDFSAFSFQGAKLMVAGEGGMLCTNSLKLYKIAKKISDHGRNPNKTFWIDGPGLKYKISNIQAAFVLGQLERVNDMILMKRRIFYWYKEFLKKNIYLSLLEEKDYTYSNYWMVSASINNNSYKKRDRLIEYLKKNNIDSRPVFSPVSKYPIWNKKYKTNNIAKMIGCSSLNLPSGANLTKNEVKYICEKINSYFN